MSEFLVVTGLSGAGRTEFASDLEDLGWVVIDRLPADLMGKVADLASGPDSPWDRVAFALRSDTLDGETLAGIEELRTMVGELGIVFLDCSTEVLVQRYEGSRRPHPLGGGAGLADTIEAERALMEPVRSVADVVVDTSQLNVHELREKVEGLYGREDDRTLRLAVSSFGFKHGAPRDADLVLDCRFLPNPHWVDHLRPLTGCDAPVQEHVLGSDLARDFLARLEGLLDLLLPAFMGEGRSYLSVAFGCTGGRHRSVAIAEAVAESLRERGEEPIVTHRDIQR
ncbi:MAG: RNase adapter RapZ [Acidimicrobiales bacterium]|nr:RNase adapter RapZ [Acidimicrobiales bacterium]